MANPDSEPDVASRMAREAVTGEGADWVLHADADEFWWPLEGSIKDALAGIPPEYGAVVAPRAEFLAAPDGPGEFYERLTVRTARSLLRPKVAHRAYADVVVLGEGGHDVVVGNDLDEAWGLMRPKAAPMLRGLRPRGDDETRDRLVWSPRFPLRVFQFPLRSFEQFRTESAELLEGGGKGKGAKARLQNAFAKGNLRETYNDVASETIGRKLDKGVLVRDERLRRFMERVGDPLSGESGKLSGVWEHPSEEELDAERVQLEFDAMYLLARSDRTVAMHDLRATEDVRRLRQRAKRLKSRVRKLRGEVKALRNRQFRRRVGALGLRVRRRLRRLRRSVSR